MKNDPENHSGLQHTHSFLVHDGWQWLQDNLCVSAPHVSSLQIPASGSWPYLDLQKGSWQQLLMPPEVSSQIFLYITFPHIPLSKSYTVAKSQISETVMWHLLHEGPAGTCPRMRLDKAFRRKRRERRFSPQNKVCRRKVALIPHTRL